MACRSPAPAEILGILSGPEGAPASKDVTINGKDKGPDDDVPEGNGDSDARTLWVEYDAHGECHRDWRQVVADSIAHSWKDWPHEGPPSLLYTMKQFQKTRLRFQLWLRRHHLSKTDRTAHEVRTLVEALYLGGCYDELNLPSLAAFEALGRRLQTITEAYICRRRPTRVASCSSLYGLHFGRRDCFPGVEILGRETRKGRG